MARESSIEEAGTRALQLEGVCVLKIGHEGWPDRLVLLGAGRHVWIEWKQPGAPLTPAQVRRIKSLRENNDPVLVLDSAEGVVEKVLAASGGVRIDTSFARARRV